MEEADTSTTYILVVNLCAPKPVLGTSSTEGLTAKIDTELCFLSRLLVDAGDCTMLSAIGDDLVCCFSTADASFHAACLLHQSATRPDHEEEIAYRIRILLYNLASAKVDRLDAVDPTLTGIREMARQLPAGRIFATPALVHSLSHGPQSQFRLVETDTDQKHSEQTLYQAISHQEACTRVANPVLNMTPVEADKSLCLRWREHKLTLIQDSPHLTIGRGSQADIRIESEYVSRHHARLDFHNTDFLLSDESTNGTFVRIEEDEEVCLHSAQIVLRGSGVISPGRRICKGHGRLIYFNTN